MKRNLTIVGRMLMVYLLAVTAIVSILLVSVVLSSLVVWNTNLFNMDNGLTIVMLGLFLGFILTSWMLMHDWNGFIEMCDRERD